MKIFKSLAICLTLVLSSAASASLISITNSTAGIVDDSFDFRSFLVDGSHASAGESVVSLMFEITFSKCSFNSSTVDGCDPGTGTPYNNEIGLALIAPTGESVSLIENNGNNEDYEGGDFSTFDTGSGDFNFITILFDVTGSALGSDPASGTFSPEGDLNDFIGLDVLGDWLLFFEDDFGSDPLVFHSATLTIESSEVAVSAPATIGIFGLCLMLLHFRRQR